MRREQLGVGQLFLEGSLDANGYYVAIKDVRQSNTAMVAFKAAAPPTGLAGYAIGCIYTNTSTGARYVNTGTAASCTFSSIGTLGAGSVALANLAAAITPSHVVKYAGIASNGGGAASFDIAVTGALATDVGNVTLAASTNVVYLVKAITATDKITVTLSGDPGAATKLHYSVLRVAA